MAEGRRILLVGSGERVPAVSAALEAHGCQVSTEEVVTAANLAGADLVVLAWPAEQSAPDLIRYCRRKDPLVSVVVLYPCRLEGSALLSLGRAGAYDCVELGDASQLPEILPRLEAAMARSVHRRGPHPVGERIVGVSDKIAQVRRYIHQASESSANVLLLGETGTGKELAARAIHEASPRVKGPFVAVNCAAIPETLLESELFGHERGSFTGADRTRRGAFEIADGGTLLLDEVGDMPAAFQAKILRVLQAPPGSAPTSREFVRVGGERPLRADVRVIAATNTDLVRAAEAARFREDLLERLQVIAIHLPALRDRREDIPGLVRHFLRRYCKQEGRRALDTDEAVLQVLKAYDYPGNVRELESALRSIVTMKEAGDTIVLGDLPPKFFDAGVEIDQTPSPLLSLAEMERIHLERILGATGGNKAKTARILGISRPTLDRKIRRHGMDAKGSFTKQ